MSSTDEGSFDPSDLSWLALPFVAGVLILIYCCQRKKCCKTESPSPVGPFVVDDAENASPLRERNFTSLAVEDSDHYFVQNERHHIIQGGYPSRITPSRPRRQFRGTTPVVRPVTPNIRPQRDRTIRINSIRTLMSINLSRKSHSNLHDGAERGENPHHPEQRKSGVYRRPLEPLNYNQPQPCHSQISTISQNVEQPNTSNNLFLWNFGHVNRDELHAPRTSANTLKFNQPKSPAIKKVKSSNKCLIIAVDATPKTIGGYCVNQFEEKIEFYSLPSKTMPWVLRDKSRVGDADEFEMKNLFCALLLWEDLILVHKRVEIYTDNWAVYLKKKGVMNEYGQRVQLFIKHLRSCGGMIHLNPRKMHVHRIKMLELFQELIVPADHLSRRQHSEFMESINNGKWKHFDRSFVNGSSMVHLISLNVNKWLRNSCDKCGFRVNRSDSLKSEIAD